MCLFGSVRFGSGRVGSGQVGSGLPPQPPAVSFKPAHRAPSCTHCRPLNITIACTGEAAGPELQVSTLQTAFSSSTGNRLPRPSVYVAPAFHLIVVARGELEDDEEQALKAAQGIVRQLRLRQLYRFGNQVRSPADTFAHVP